ncbi:hypothetical protein ANAEL_05045 [Anaerolineales bacterium]|nr:hypothetical protein ANAEL_05045 [Anaerolineales bacterium]
MKITFEQSGGFMGLKSGLAIDLSDLPSDDAETLRRLVDESNFFTLAENPPARPVPDGFQYTITIETKMTKHTVHMSDTTIPEELRPLLQELSHRARPQRRQ